MKKKTDRIIAGIMFGGALIAISAFTCWRMEINSPKHQNYVSMYFEQSREAEEIKRESEKAAEIAKDVYKQKPETVEIIALEITETETEETTAQETTIATAETCDISCENALESTTALADDKIYIETQEVAIIAFKRFTAEEENLLMRVASCEAGNQGWIGMALVMNVVLNRSATFNLSIKDVILAPGQFSVVGCEKWNNGYIAPEALTALQAVKDGWDGSQGALFFCAPSGRSVWMATTRQYLFTAYGHEFYR